MNVKKIFLSIDELQFLTGKKRPTAQINILKQKGFEFTVNARGQPVITRKHVETMLSKHTRQEQFTPNFDAIR